MEFINDYRIAYLEVVDLRDEEQCTMEILIVVGRGRDLESTGNVPPTHLLLDFLRRLKGFYGAAYLNSPLPLLASYYYTYSWNTYRDLCDRSHTLLLSLKTPGISCEPYQRGCNISQNFKNNYLCT
ncbi:hypothetical protein HZH68_004516 [Vespula germanica]|uniref:Uncharacterized protein n=1 Tax=Vespula germanica TaxID=30212 RepID=A0A834NID4_VESGE|nr:hypothetical protein HZH68_004516 [Vespula germanica]